MTDATGWAIFAVCVAIAAAYVMVALVGDWLDERETWRGRR